jgi:hypothetical protein
MSNPTYACPRCGQQTIGEVEEFGTDFLAVHKLERGLVKSSATGRMIECVIAVKVCTANYSTNRTDFQSIERPKKPKTIEKTTIEPKGLF